MLKSLAQAPITTGFIWSDGLHANRTHEGRESDVTIWDIQGQHNFLEVRSLYNHLEF